MVEHVLTSGHHKVMTSFKGSVQIVEGSVQIFEGGITNLNGAVQLLSQVPLK